MMKKTALIITITVIVAACLISVTACGTPKITDVKSLAAANIAAQAKVKSYHMDGNVEMDIALDSEELQGILGSVDVQSVETYLDTENKAAYTKAGESTERKKSESQRQQLGLKELAGDKTTLLVSSIEFRDVDVRGRGVYEDVSVKLKFPLNAVFKFGRYNEFKEAEYAIPKELTADNYSTGGAEDLAGP